MKKGWKNEKTRQIYAKNASLGDMIDTVVYTTENFESPSEAFFYKFITNPK